MDLKITGAKLSGDTERDVKTLANHVFQLEEQLRYQLRNLDVTNFNDLGLARYENGRMQIYAKEVEIQTDKLRVEFGKETDDIYAAISATAGELQTTISAQGKEIGGLKSQVAQTSDKISAVVSAVGDNGNVTAASIVAAINAAGSSVKISADHVNISGELVTVSDLAGTGKVEINAGNIAANGTITGCKLVTKKGTWTNISIDEDSIEFAEHGFVGLGSDGRLGVFSNSSDLELAGNRIRFYNNDPYMRRGHWTFFDQGLVFFNEYGEPVMQIVAEFI